MTARIYELVKKGRSKRTGREAWHVHQRAFTSLVDVEAFLHNFQGVGRFAIAEFDRESHDDPDHDLAAERLAEFTANHGLLEPSIDEILGELRR